MAFLRPIPIRLKADSGAEVGTVDISFVGAVNAGNIELSYTENNGDSGTLTWVARRMSL